MDEFTDSLRQARAAIMDAWHLADDVEKAQLLAASNIVKELLAPRESTQGVGLANEA